MFSYYIVVGWDWNPGDGQNKRLYVRGCYLYKESAKRRLYKLKKSVNDQSTHDYHIRKVDARWRHWQFIQPSYGKRIT